MSGPRYAIFFVPPAGGALDAFGAAALGYDSYSGTDCGAETPTAPEHGLGAEEWRRLTAEPRKYGFHATLKAPFRLRSETSELDLIAEFARFAASQTPPDGFAAKLELLDGFAALVPSATVPSLDLLAGNCVRGFDQFRDALTAAERSRRLTHPLTPRQIDHLDRFGYPYVFEDFRFHMTLSGRLPAERKAQCLASLGRLHKRWSVPAEILVDSVALLRQGRSDAPFRVIATAALQVPADTPAA
jgi:Protein of unknown function (DUF1045)